MEYQRLVVLLLVVAVVFVLARLPVLLRVRKVRGTQLDGLARLLPGDQDAGGRWLLYFWSPSCGMCRNTTPIINDLQSDRGDIISVNAAQELDLARQAGIMGTPAFVLVEQGRVESLVMGARNRRQIEAMLDRGA